MLDGEQAMFTADELLQNASEYQSGSMAFDAFEQWFENNSVDAYTDPDIDELRAAVDGALAQYYYDGVGEDVFRKELVNAIRPFVLGEQSVLTLSAKTQDC